MNNSNYRVYSNYLKDRYGEKVYKLPVNIPSTCPNRDGRKDTKGCIFCGAAGAGHELLDKDLSITKQLQTNRELIEKKYKAHKFIAYFQSFSNTYLDFDKFKDYMLEAATFPDIVELSISTRPDCIDNKHLDFLKELHDKYNVNITIELGLQTANNNTLEVLNRHHTVEDYIEAAKRIKLYGFELCTHLITDLPWDSDEDILQTAKIINEANSDYIKVHSLYVEKNTQLEEMYKNGFKLLESNDFINRTILLLENLNPDIVIERLVGRVPESDSVIANWHQSWWKIRDQINNEIERRNTYQGKYYKSF